MKNCIQPLILIALGALGACAPSNKKDLFEEGKSMGQVSAVLEEASGLAASVNNPGDLWTLNDSGNSAEVFLINAQAEIVLTCTLKGIKNRDWEEIAVGPGPEEGVSYLYVGEIGDNDARYDLKYIYRFPEPVDEGEKEQVITAFDTLIVQLPDGKRDMEAFSVDPKSRDIYLISKREENVNVYWQSSNYMPSDTLTPELITTLPFHNVVAADFSRDGSEFLLKTYDEILYWNKKDGITISQMLQQPPKKLPYTSEPQGESITWAIDGSGFYTLSESVKNEKAYLYFYKRN